MLNTPRARRRLDGWLVDLLRLRRLAPMFLQVLVAQGVVARGGGLT